MYIPGRAGGGTRRCSSNVQASTNRRLGSYSELLLVLVGYSRTVGIYRSRCIPLSQINIRDSVISLLVGGWATVSKHVINLSGIDPVSFAEKTS